MAQDTRLKAGSHLVVIGGGIVGIVCALEFLRHKFEVTILEPGEPGGEQSCSFGNSGWISPSLVIPFSVPGLWKKIPKYLLDSHGPLTIDPRHLPHMIPWLVRYLKAGSTMERVTSTARALNKLLHDCMERHTILAEAAGVPHLISRNGQIQVYRTGSDFEAEDRFWSIRREFGAKWVALNAEELRRREPRLETRHEAGVWVDGCSCVDPGAYVSALGRLAVARGASIIRAAAKGFVVSASRLRAVATEGEDISCDAAIVSAGAWSGGLAGKAGDNIPLQAERGYHVRFSGRDGLPSNRLVLMDAKLSANPSQDGLRVTGQNELTGLGTAPNWKRAEILRDLAVKSFPQLATHVEAGAIRFWMGYRPSTPDGRPVIGRSRGCPDIFYAFGHGHIGVATSPNTARLLTDLVLGADPDGEVSAFSPTRFNT